MSSTRTALQIIKVLMEDGQLDRENHSSLFIEYAYSEVLDVLSEFEEELDCRIIKIHNTLYLLPGQENNLLGFRHKDFREWLPSSSKMNDIFLSYYVSMLIFHEFYGGKNKNPKQREFLSVTALIEALDKRFEKILSDKLEMVLEQEEKLEINIKSIAENWMQKIVFEENKRNTKHAFVLRICALLEQEKLIRLMEDKREIRTTKKLDDLMTFYFLNDSRIEDINQIFKGVHVDAANQ